MSPLPFCVTRHVPPCFLKMLMRGVCGTYAYLACFSSFFLSQPGLEFLKDF